MTVYIVMYGNEKEFIGVFSTIEKAKDKIARMIKEELLWCNTAKTSYRNMVKKQVENWLKGTETTINIMDGTYFIETRKIDEN